MNASFDLVSEPWIPCIMPGGSRQDLGLLDTLARAHEIREVNDPSPLVTVSLHRLMFAILHRNFGPKTIPDWKQLWRQGAWDTKALEAYFKKYADRFDLFDESRPFYQARNMPECEIHPVHRLAQEAASGNNATLFDHSFDSTPSVFLPGVAARYLVAYQSFAIGFGKSNPFYFQDGPTTRGMLILNTGENLFQTLSLNMIRYAPQNDLPFPRSRSDRPAWEFDHPRTPEQAGTYPEGYLDYLTWQSRSVQLIPEEIGGKLVVRTCKILQNLSLPKEGVPSDPMKKYVADPEAGLRPLSINPRKAVWRDSHTLFQINKTDDCANVLEWIATLDLEGVELPPCALSIFGFTTQKGKAASILLWTHERLPLAVEYLKGGELLTTLKNSLDIAEDAGRLFSASTIERRVNDKTTKIPSPCLILANALISPLGTNKPSFDDARDLISSLAPEQNFWARMEPPFRRLVVQLPRNLTNETEAWKVSVKDVAKCTFDSMVNSLDYSPRTMKAIAEAERMFNIELARIVR